jgi:hypothetical protein
MHAVIKVLAAVAAIYSGMSVGADGVSEPKGQFCWPMHFAGVVLGVSQDSHVQRLLGRGIRRATPGDGARYYVDAKHTGTLRVVTHTDAIVGEVSIAVGIDPAISGTNLARATSKFFDPLEGFGNWHALRLGSSTEEVLKNLGEPRRRKSADAWVYEAACTCELPEYLTIYFSKGRISRVVFSAPPG